MTSVDPRVGELLARIAREAEDSGGRGFTLQSALDALRQAARGEDLAPVRNVAREQVDLARESFGTAVRTLSQLASRLDELAVIAAPRGERAKSLAPDEGGGLTAWARELARALVDGNLADFTSLGSAGGPALRGLPRLRTLAVDATSALAEKRWLDAAPLVRILAAVLTQDGKADTADRELVASLLVLLARIELFVTGDHGAAREWYKRALQQAPDSGLPHAFRSAWLAREGEYSRGIRRARRAIELSPRRPEGHVALGMCAEGQDVAGAGRYYDRAVETVWDDVDPLRSLLGLLAPAPNSLLLRFAERSAKESDRAEQALTALELVGPQGTPADPSRGARGVGAADEAARDAALAPVEALRFHLHKDQGRLCEAAAVLRTGAESLDWESDPESVERLLREALRLDPESAAARWTLADLLRWRSYAIDPQFVCGPVAREAQRLWNEAAELDPVQEHNAWVLHMRAGIAEQLGRLPGEDRAQWLWRAVLDIEHGLLLGSGSPMAYTLLCRFLGLLAQPALALEAGDAALELDPTYEAARQERLLVLANTGQWDPALRLLDQLADDSFADVIRAFVLSRTGEVERALELLEKALAETKMQPWQLELRSFCLRELGQREAAERDLAEVWDQRDPDRREDTLSFASAGYRLGHYAAAAELVRPLVGDSLSGPEAARITGCCLLARGEIEIGLDLVADGLSRARSAFEVAEFVRHHLRPLADRAVVPEAPPGLADALLPIESLVDRARTRLITPRTAAGELEEALAAHTSSDTSRQHSAAAPAWSSLAIAAIHARRAGTSGQWRVAGQAYRRLLVGPPPFPAAHLGLRRAIDALGVVADEALQAGDPAPADSACSDALELLAGLPDEGAERFRGLHLRRSLAAIERGDLTVLETELVAAVLGGADEPVPEHPLADAGEEVGRATRELLRDPAHYWAVYSAWSELAVRGRPEIRIALGAAIPQLEGWVQSLLERPSAYADPASIGPVAPVVVELGAGLIPENTAADAWTLLGEHIPAVRRRVVDATGVPVPGWRLWGPAELPDNGYLLRLDEIPAASGQLPPASWYCDVPAGDLATRGIPEDALTPARDPVSGSQTCWARLPDRADVPADPAQVHEASVWLVRHVEAVLRADLSALLNVDAVQQMLAQPPWRAVTPSEPDPDDEGDTVLPDPILPVFTTLPDENTWLRFARLLRELAREHVPLVDWPALLQAAVGRPLALPDLGEALAELRQVVRERLPGNGPEVHRVRVPLAWETQAAHADPAGKLQWQLSLDRTARDLQRIVAYVGERQPQPVALVVRSVPLRPQVRRMCEASLPDVPVLAEAELCRPDELARLPELPLASEAIGA